jgi:DNA-directed RNA polymerase specialized sigma24 family protein
MSASHSVTCWLQQLKAGDLAAAQPLWERYLTQLVRLARGKLGGARPRAADEEDVALSAFDLFCRGVARNRFPQLSDRNDLWGLLLTLTEHKAIDLVRRERRQKRGGGRVGGESALPHSPEGEHGIEQVIGPEPTPAFAAQVAEECQRLLDLLDEDELRDIALWKMEGHTNAEIARKLDCAEPTVERRLKLIRNTWKKELKKETPP